MLSGCAHSVHQVHVSEINQVPTSGAGRIVRAEAEQFVVLGVARETQFVEQAYSRLLQQCSGQPINGVSTQFMTSLGFFSWTNKVLVQGYCAQP
jgi:hypothetical protein